MLTCAICNKEGLDLTFHLQHKHQLTVEQYKVKYNALVVDPSVELKRKETCEKVHGDPNYKNEEARKLSFEVYGGGHPFSDPKMREAAREIKKELYGDPDYTNREQAKETIKAKYGVENVANIPGVAEKRVKTNLERYGKVFNYDPVPLLTKEQLEDLHYNQGKNLSEIGRIYSTSGEGVAYWMKKYGIEYNKKIKESKDLESESLFIKAQELFKVLSKDCGLARSSYQDNALGVSTSSLEYYYGTWNKFITSCGLQPENVVQKPEDRVKDFLEACVSNNKILSFDDYEKILGRSCRSLKYLKSNEGKSLIFYQKEIETIALDPSLWETFLLKFKK